MGSVQTICAAVMYIFTYFTHVRLAFEPTKLIVGFRNVVYEYQKKLVKRKTTVCNQLTI